jgi:hypothetical protein
VAVVGHTGVQLSNRLWANANGDRAKEKIEAVLKEWGKYQVVVPGDHSDLVLVVLESQKNLSLVKRANLVAELKVTAEGRTSPTRRRRSGAARR